ncbi:N-acetylmuramoyl-L-alanine amidase-like domain-containing protein [Flagellimonas eckloniae]|uniref:DUF1460 domain-containing protein n=1 Tax=Flagellimonas eckloniae TaxID=346185 RepID=A0A0Q0XHG1_9FLAO|nr:N-acetylmuramoyl-L-alanine amidase-like domain-containing protein [Allomuricauda eckloniae]KQC30488.1 hypothetical protein AAY42_11870 [Allomuricauda eckloniae]
MLHRICIYLIFVFTLTLNSQITYSPLDSTLFYSKLTELKDDSIVEIGKSFLGTPYVEKTLEIGDKESIVINLRGFDCTTYVENVLAFGLMLQNNQTDFESFTENLKTIRYRNSVLDGYPSRLHYFTDWIKNNESKGLVKDITSSLGGIEVNKSINFMGTHRSLYPFLKNDKNFEDMLKVEKELAKQSLCILPQNQIENNEHLIQSGDIIALATSIKGLDVTHTGFAIRQNGRIHLLHASSSGSVRITEEPLVDYLRKIKNNIGIVVARPQ